MIRIALRAAAARLMGRAPVAAYVPADRMA